MMQYLILIADNEKQWESYSETQLGAVMQEFASYSEELKRGGHYRLGQQLQPSTTATTLRTIAGKLETIDGPFAETKEQLGGFYLIDAKDLDQALALARRCPGHKYGSVEVRPLVPDQA
jgi:hypothetical protein